MYVPTSVSLYSTKQWKIWILHYYVNMSKHHDSAAQKIGIHMKYFIKLETTTNFHAALYERRVLWKKKKLHRLSRVQNFVLYRIMIHKKSCLFCFWVFRRPEIYLLYCIIRSIIDLSISDSLPRIQILMKETFTACSFCSLIHSLFLFISKCCPTTFTRLSVHPAVAVSVFVCAVPDYSYKVGLKLFLDARTHTRWISMCVYYLSTRNLCSITLPRRE